MVSRHTHIRPRQRKPLGTRRPDDVQQATGGLRFSDATTFAETRVGDRQTIDSSRIEVRCPAAYPIRGGRDALAEHIVPACVRSTAIRPWTIGGTSWHMTTGHEANRTL